MAKAHLITDLRPRAETRDVLPSLFSVRIAELWSWARHLPFPERVQELHDMRIAAKRLRYCFEFFMPCFAPEFKDVLKRFKQLQDLLGEIHDSDVWIDYFRTQLHEAFQENNAHRKALGRLSGADYALRSAAQQLAADLAHGPVQGLLGIIDDVAARRQKLYLTLLEFWQEAEAQGFRNQLTAAVAAAAAPANETGGS